jgi:hypothetical protein
VWQKFTDISEEPTAFIFRIEEYAKKAGFGELTASRFRIEEYAK